MSNPVIPLFNIGQDCVVAITPQVSDIDGNLSDATLGQQSFFGRIESSGDSFNIQSDDISPIGILTDNPTIFQVGGNYDITEYPSPLPLVTSAHTGEGYGNVLRAVIDVSYEVKIVATFYAIDGSTIRRQETWYMQFESFGKDKPKAKNTDKATFKLRAIIDSVSSAEIPNPIIA